MSTDFLQITGFENGEFQLCPLDEKGADKLRLEVAVGIVKAIPHRKVATISPDMI